MKVILEHYLLGTAPPTPNSITSVELDHRDLRGGTVEFRRVKLNFGPEDRLAFEAAVFVPKNGEGAVSDDRDAVVLSDARLRDRADDVAGWRDDGSNDAQRSVLGGCETQI